MAWSPTSRDEFHRIVLSGWGLLTALLFLAAPLLMAFYVARGFVGDGPTDLHKGARFAYFAYPLSGFAAGVTGAAIPLVVLLSSVVAPLRRGALLGRLAAFGALAAGAWLVPVVVLGLTFVGVNILAPALLAFGVLLLELGAWIGLATVASGARRVSPALAAAAVLAALAFLGLGSTLAVELVRAEADGFEGFQRAEVWRLGLSAATPSAAALTLRGFLFPGNGGFSGILDTPDVEVPAALQATATWFLIVIAWTAALLLAGLRAERAAERAERAAEGAAEHG